MRPVDPMQLRAERLIREAMERGEFDNLPGTGKPLNIPDESGVPEDLRMALHVLRNAGCLPPEMELKKEIQSLRELLAAVEDDDQRASIRRQIDFRILKFNMMRRTPFNLDDHPEYCDRVLERLGRQRRP